MASTLWTADSVAVLRNSSATPLETHDRHPDDDRDGRRDDDRAETRPPADAGGRLPESLESEAGGHGTRPHRTEDWCADAMADWYGLVC
jgi:hypothetical protein